MWEQIFFIFLVALTTISFGGDFVFMVNSGCDFGPLMLEKKNDQLIQVTPKNCDTLFKKQDWQNAPQVMAPDVSQTNKYFLMMLDPDAPNQEPGVFYFHWAVANIPGTYSIVHDPQGKSLRSGSGDLHKGDVLLSYKGPNLPKGSTQHRYVFLLYEQDDNSTIREKPEKRAHFDLGCWLNPLAKRHPLTGPVAGSQFRIMPDM